MLSSKYILIIVFGEIAIKTLNLLIIILLYNDRKLIIDKEPSRPFEGASKELGRSYICSCQGAWKGIWIRIYIWIRINITITI